MQTPAKHILEWVKPGTWTEQDRAWLELADKAGPAYHSLTLDQISQLIFSGDFHLFRIAPQRGVVLVEVRKSLAGLKRLAIVRIGGENVGWVAAQVAQLLQHTAAEWGCQEIESMVYSPRLAKALQRLGGKPEAVNMVVEVKNG